MQVYVSCCVRLQSTLSNVALQALGKRAAQGLVDSLRGQVELMPVYLSYQGQQMANLEKKNLQLQVCKRNLLLPTSSSLYTCNLLCCRCLTVLFVRHRSMCFLWFSRTADSRPLALHLKT